MDKEEFNQLLLRAKLTKKEFAEHIDMTYGAVNNWGSSQQFPRWVESWLQNYIKAKISDDIIEAVKPFVK
jgi:DNA-binding transcriptional regulator YiaG